MDFDFFNSPYEADIQDFTPLSSRREDGGEVPKIIFLQYYIAFGEMNDI
jgi:hypothetical protein